MKYDICLLRNENEDGAMGIVASGNERSIARRRVCFVFKEKNDWGKSRRLVLN